MALSESSTCLLFFRRKSSKNSKEPSSGMAIGKTTSKLLSACRSMPAMASPAGASPTMWHLKGSGINAGPKFAYSKAL